MGERSVFGLYTIGFFLIMFVQQIITFFFEHHHFHYVNESGVAIIVGTIGALVGFAMNDNFNIVTSIENSLQQKSFSSDLFFFVLVPILFYAEGYSMQKRHFFKYILYSSSFGVIGTFINANLLYLFTSILNRNGMIVSDGEILELETFEIVAFAIIMSSVECVVAKSIVDIHYRPKLHNILFGEELMNDVTVYSLFVALLTITEEGEQKIPFDLFSYFKFLGLFFGQFIAGVLIGIFFGLLFSFIAKLLRKMLQTELSLSAYVLYTGYLSYSISKYLHLAGAVTIFVVGIMFSHYLTYNIPKACLDASRNTIKLMAFVSETFIFLYLGLSFTTTFFSPIDSQYELIPWKFLIIISFIIFGLRMLCVFGLVGFVFLTKMRTVETYKLSFYDVMIISCSGLVRGSVAFALIQYLKGEVNVEVVANDVPEGHVIESEITGYKVLRIVILILIIASNLIMGVILPLITKLCIEKMKSLGLDEKQTIKEQEKIKAREEAQQNRKVTFKRRKEQLSIRKQSKAYWKRFDNEFLKPAMIYEYVGRRPDIIMKQKAKVEHVQPDSHVLEHEMHSVFSDGGREDVHGNHDHQEHPEDHNDEHHEKNSPNSATHKKSHNSHHNSEHSNQNIHLSKTIADVSDPISINKIAEDVAEMQFIKKLSNKKK